MDTPTSSKSKIPIFLVLFILLVFIYLQSFLQNSQATISICTDSSYSNIHVRINNTIDIIIEPKNIRNFLSCLGKSMPFYDRTIEYVIGSISERDNFELTKRYKIGKILKTSNPSFDSISITKYESIVVINQTTDIVVIQKILTSPFISSLNNLSNESKIYYPKPNQSVEKLLKKKFPYSQSLENGNFRQLEP